MHTIVVGAGSAGSVLAARLTETEAHQVTLVEAGPDYPTWAQVPKDLKNGKQNSMRLHDWGYRLKPNREQTVPFDFPRGRVIGGSSSVNTCIALSGQPYDYDEWAALGLPEWSYDAVLPSFIRVESDQNFPDSPIHGKDGPVPLRRHPPEELTPWQAGFVEACQTLGHSYVADHNDPSTPTGVGPHPMNKINGERMSCSKSYLTESVRKRSNLTIQAGVHTRRVLFDNGRFAGLEVERNGMVEVLRADRLILSAGAVGSLGILLRSGIGPAAEIARLGVELVVDSPSVGRRLMDHPGVALFFAPRGGVSKVSDPLIQTLLRTNLKGSGYIGDHATQPGSNVPLAGITFPLVTMMSSLGKPRGHGTIRFHSADPHAKPEVHSLFLEDPWDVERTIDAVELMWRIYQTKPMREMAFPLFPSRSFYKSRAAIRSHIPFATGSGYHPSGTVPMSGRSIDEGALDGRGAVKGVENVFVADASVMPTIPSVNTNLPTIMIGERMAELLR